MDNEIPLMRELATWARDGLDLVERYEGWYVAIWHDDILAIDPDESEVYLRAYEVLRAQGVLYPSQEAMLVKQIVSQNKILRG
ncbi:MAG: hypothetical protein JWN23_614 [Rhodocyclales bacterium]|nr:hypothetical protein [Rhodocyclales bacterium]